MLVWHDFIWLNTNVMLVKSTHWLYLNSRLLESKHYNMPKVTAVNKNERAKEKKKWGESQRKARLLSCVLQAHLFGLFTCKSLLIRGWRGTDDRSRLSSPPVMRAYLRALRLYRVNSALTERHAAERPGGTATQRLHIEDAETLITLTSSGVRSQEDFYFIFV